MPSEPRLWRRRSGARVGSGRGMTDRRDNRRQEEALMAMQNTRTTAKIADHPTHAMLILFPIAFLVARLVCDLIFWRSGNGAWSTAALWLPAAALMMAA